MIPWEESEIFQEGNYRLLRWAAIFLTLLTTVISILTGDWSVLGYWLLGLGAVLAVYAGTIWSVAHLVILVIRGFKRLFRREHKT